MGPGQEDVRSHRADRERLVSDAGDAPVGGPVVGYQLGLRRSHRAEHESVDLALAKALDHLEPGTPRLAAVDFDRAGDQHLSYASATPRHDDRIVLAAERNDRFIGL